MPTTTRKASVLAVTLSAVLALAGCTDDEPTPGAAGPGPDSGTARVSVTGYPGLYYDESAVAVLAGPSGQVQLTGAMACSDLDAMLSAGQWRTVDRITLPAGVAGLARLGGVVPGLLLQRGDDLVFVAFEGVGELCTGTVTQVQRDGIALTGPGFPGSATGWAATTSCIRVNADRLNVGVYFDTADKIGGVVNTPMVSQDGKYTVDGASDDLGLTVLTHTSHVLEVFGEAYAAGGAVEGVTMRILRPGPSFAGTASVEAGEADRPHGTISLSGLADAETGAEASVTLPFSCPAVQVMTTG